MMPARIIVLAFLWCVGLGVLVGWMLCTGM